MPRRSVSLAPLMGTNAARIADGALDRTFMRGGYNVEARDGEWWTRKGEANIAARLGSTPWWWIIDVNQDLIIICNAWYALVLSSQTEATASKVSSPYAAAITESVSYTLSSLTCTSATTRVADQLMLIGTQPTSEVYRVKSRSGTTITLDRAYEGASGAKSTAFYDPLARDTTGAATTHSDGARVLGSAVVFEQLVSHTATAIHAASPVITGGNLLLVITSNQGVPVAIDLTAYLAASPAAVKRLIFYKTNLSTPTVIGSDTASDGLKPRGIFAGVYKGRLFIGAASDANGAYGSRTVWWSQIGDALKWHVGIAGQTAAPNYKTFDGEGNAIAGVAVLGEDIVMHRDDSQEIGSATQSAAQPFAFQTNRQGIGLRGSVRANRVVVANDAHYMWTTQGPMVFDGRRVSPIAPESLRAIFAQRFAQIRTPVTLMAHDSLLRRVYFWATSGARHQDALPANAGKTSADGNAYDEYIPVFVFDYLTGSSWFEDRPYAAGAGMASTANGLPAQLHLSRIDGTIVRASGRNKALDASIAAPETSGSDIAVNAQVETPWVNFGGLSRKSVPRVEVITRALAGEGLYDGITGISGNLWLRMRVYVDYNSLTARADVGCIYDSATAQASDLTEFSQSALLVQDFTPRAHGRQFKFVFSNALTAAATTAGYVQAPFRISDIQPEVVQQEGTLPLTDVTGASISE